MGYFSNFPLVRLQMGGKEVLGLNLAKRSYIPRDFFEDEAYYLTYNVQDGETPEMIADRIYDDPDLSWIILQYNQILDPVDQWPMDTNAFQRYVQRKYGDDLYNVRYYESAETGAQVGSDWPEYDRVPFTNFDHESRENERRREIRVLLPDFVTDVVAQHKIHLRQRYRGL